MLGNHAAILTQKVLPVLLCYSKHFFGYLTLQLNLYISLPSPPFFNRHITFYSETV